MAINNPACGLGIGWFVDHCLPWFKYNTRHFVLPFSFNEGSGRLSNSTTPPSLLPPPSSLLPSPLPAPSSPPNCEHTYSGTEDGPAHVRQHAKQNHQGPTTPQSILEENNPQAPNMYSLYEEGYRQSRGRGEKRGKRGWGGGGGVKREKERGKMDASWERELSWRVSGRGILWQVKRRTPFSSLWSCSQDGALPERYAVLAV